jgi:hypothetical protein
MDTSSAPQLVRFVLPRDLAHELMVAGVAAPYVRDDRTDPTLIPTLITAAVTAATTVVVTQLTQESVRGLTERLRKWLGRPTGEGKIELSIRSDGQQITKTVTMTANVSEMDVMSLMREAIAMDSKVRPGDDT